MPDRIPVRPAAAPPQPGFIRPHEVHNDPAQQLLRSLNSMTNAVEAFDDHQLQRDVSEADSRANATLAGMTLDDAKALIKSGQMDETESPYYRAAFYKAYGQRVANTRARELHGFYENGFDKMYGDLDGEIASRTQEDLGQMKDKFYQAGYEQAITPKLEALRTLHETEKSKLTKQQNFDNLTSNLLDQIASVPPSDKRGDEVSKLAHGWLGEAQQTFHFSNQEKDGLILSVARNLASSGNGNVPEVEALLNKPRSGVPPISSKAGEQGALAESLLKHSQIQQRQFQVESHGVERAGLWESASSALGWLPGVSEDRKLKARDGWINRLDDARSNNLITGEEEKTLLQSWDANYLRLDAGADDDSLRKLQQDWKDGITNANLRVLMSGQGFNPQHQKTVFAGHENKGYYEFAPQEQRQLLKDRIDEALQKQAEAVKEKGGDPDAAYYSGMAKLYPLAGLVNENLRQSLQDNAVGFRAPEALSQKELSPAQAKALKAFQIINAQNPGMIDQHTSGEAATFWKTYDTIRKYQEPDDLRALQLAGKTLNSDPYKQKINDPDQRQRVQAQVRSVLNMDAWLGLFGQKATNADEVETEITRLATMFAGAGGMKMEDAILKGAERVKATSAVVNGRVVYKMGQEVPANFEDSVHTTLQAKFQESGYSAKEAKALSKSVSIAPDGQSHYLLWNDEGPMRNKNGDFLVITNDDLWSSTAKARQLRDEEIVRQHAENQQQEAKIRAVDATYQATVRPKVTPQPATLRRRPSS